MFTSMTYIQQIFRFAWNAQRARRMGTSARAGKMLRGKASDGKTKIEVQLTGAAPLCK